MVLPAALLLTVAAIASPGTMDYSVDLKILQRVFPGSKIVEVADGRGERTQALELDPNRHVWIQTVRRASVTGARQPDTVIAFLDNVAGEDSRSETLGLAVFNGSHMVCSTRFEELFAIRAIQLDIDAVHPRDPAAIRLTRVETGDPATPRQYESRTTVLKSSGGTFRSILESATPVNRWPQPCSVLWSLGPPIREGWRDLVQTTVACGDFTDNASYLDEDQRGAGKRELESPDGLAVETTIWRFRDGTYQQGETKASTTGPKFRLFPIAPGTTAWDPWTISLPLIAQLNDAAHVVYHKERWRGPKTFSARLEGGSIGFPSQPADIFRLRVIDSTPRYPENSHADIEKTDHAELWIWKRGGEHRVIQLALSPGDFHGVPPVVRQWLPSGTALLDGIRLDARRTPEGYDLAVWLAGPLRIRSEYAELAYSLISFSVVDASALDPGSQQCMLSTSPTHRWADETTFSPVRLLTKPLATSTPEVGTE